MDSKDADARNNQARIIEERDKINPSPSVRADAIWQILNHHEPRPKLWDLICFSVETLAVAVESYPFLLSAIKSLSRMIYAIHYNGEELIESFVEVKKNEGD
jgi:hypothetical protein